MSHNSAEHSLQHLSREFFSDEKAAGEDRVMEVEGVAGVGGIGGGTPGRMWEIWSHSFFSYSTAMIQRYRYNTTALDIHIIVQDIDHG